MKKKIVGIQNTTLVADKIIGWSIDKYTDSDTEVILHVYTLDKKFSFIFQSKPEINIVIGALKQLFPIE